MKTNWNRRIFSLVLCMALLLTGFSVAVYAQEAQPAGEITGSGVAENETPIEVDVAEAEDVPVDGSFTLTDDGEPVLEVTHQNERAVTGAYDGTMMNGFYTADFVMPDTGYNVFLTGLTKNNVARIKQAIIDNYVEGKLFEMKNLGFIDVEKTWYGGDDSLMCGPAAASNMLVGSGWAAQAGFTNSDDVFEAMLDAFPNQGTAEETVISWFFSGITSGSYDSPGFKGYLPQYNYENNDMMEYFGDFDNQIGTIYNRLHEGYTASISLYLYRFEDHGCFGAHAVTLWGFVTDPGYPASSKEHYKYIFVTDSDSNLAKKGKDRRTAPDVMSMIPIEYKNLYEKGWGYWYSDPPVCDVRIYGATTLRPYSPDIPYETSPDATLDRANDPDVAVDALILTDEPKDKERFDELDHEEIVSDPDYWIEEYEPNYASEYDRSKLKTEFTPDVTIYFCPYLKNKSNVVYRCRYDDEKGIYSGIYTRLTVTDAQGEVIFLKNYDVPTYFGIRNGNLGEIFYSFKAQLPPGDYTATFEFNPNHTVPEALYMNNTKSVDFKVREPQLLGDADEDGKITILDVTQIQRVLAGSKNPTASIKKLGDVDQNGDLDVVDATLLQRWLLGLDQELTIGKKV
ncbi:dockerin type I repeat-containing protein [Ruminococcus difficilis]|uniref:Dockerin type I repeat-containing protein n=1 Tax=Ruminococcus difficilis TaxID=2763069 RepID=A0A934U0H9_9FIRM|nr:dockerin type I repeat-containing protein [Ruminococcus difficilis]MBK6088315.1 dockerin type I repeat-containing protein [Ruminococcus difficilis]